jgi:prepilin-type processing-associated H-X9-DG protein
MPGRATHLRNRSPRCVAFTLLEVLVVIGVIAVLIGVLLPALLSVRQSSRTVQCAANLRQWSQALHLYVQQYDGWLPRRGQGAQPAAKLDRPDDWFNALPLMLHQSSYQDLVATGRAPKPDDSSIWVCPNAVGDAKGKNFFAYAMNMGLSIWSTATPDKANTLGPWSTMVFMTDAPGSFCATWPSGATPAEYAPVARHRGRMNIAFIDGHVAALLPAEAFVSAAAKGVGPDTPIARWWVPRSPWTGPKSN